MNIIGHFINGKETKGKTNDKLKVFNPSNGEIISYVHIAGKDEVRRAINFAKEAQVKWEKVNVQKRTRIIRNFIDLVNKNIHELSTILSKEHGKTLLDSNGDIQRGIEVAEFCLGIPHLLKGEFSENVSENIDMYSLKQPIGIAVGITPFNFPAMIPMWKFCPAIACGNAFILKPSEKNPSVPIMLAKLFTEAGLPDGVLQVINGDKATVDTLIEDKHVDAVGFVGSTPIAEYIYSKSSSFGKRVQCFGGAKNHMVIMPDADLDQVSDNLIGASFGAAGERCMSISVAVPVGEKTGNNLKEILLSKIKKLKVGPFNSNEKIDFGPLISLQAKNRVSKIIKNAQKEGAELLIDGSNISINGYENGFYIGPTLFDRVQLETELYKEEIFGPVLSIVRAKDVSEAKQILIKNQYGNGAAIYTNDGEVARNFVREVNIGMIGINIPIPVPLAFYTFGGWKKSAFGDLNQHGPDSIKFYTKTKTVTAKWQKKKYEKINFSLPTSEKFD